MPQDQRFVKIGGKVWKETWYNREKQLPRGSDEANETFNNHKFDQGGFLDASMNSGNVSMLSDKWTIDLQSGGRLRGQTWGMMHEESQKVKAVFGQQWDKRHAKYGGQP